MARPPVFPAEEKVGDRAVDPGRTVEEPQHAANTQRMIRAIVPVDADAVPQ
jgi:hypothetical protein